MERPSRVELWTQFDKLTGGRADEREKAEAAVAAAELLDGDDAGHQELWLIVATKNAILSRITLAASLRNGIKARGVDPFSFPPDNDAGFKAYGRAVADVAYATLKAMPRAPAFEPVYPLNEADFARMLAIAVTPDGYDPAPPGGSLPPEAEAAFSERLKAARTIIAYRQFLEGSRSGAAFDVEHLQPIYERIKAEHDARKAAEEKAAARAKALRPFFLLGAVPCGVISAFLILVFVLATMHGQVQHWQLFAAFGVFGGCFVYCASRVLPALLLPSGIALVGVPALNLLLAGGPRFAVGGVSSSSIILLAVILMGLTAWLFVPFGQRTPEDRQAMLKEALGARWQDAARSAALVCLVLMTAKFVWASFSHEVPTAFSWVLLGISGFAYSALVVQRDPALIAWGIGFPMLAMALAFLRGPTGGAPLMIYFMAGVAAEALLILPDPHGRKVAITLFRNITRDGASPATWLDLDDDKGRRARMQITFTAAYWLLFFTIEMLVWDFAGPFKVLAEFVSAIALLLWGFGGDRFKSRRLYFNNLHNTISRIPDMEGPERQEHLIVNGRLQWVAKGHQGGKWPKGHVYNPASVRFADAPDSDEPARPGYVKKFDPYTGNYEWVQIITGNPNIKAEPEPLRPGDEYGGNRPVSEPVD
jgi:hypothetical protein